MQKTVIRTGRDKPVYLTLFEQGYKFVKVQNYRILKLMSNKKQPAAVLVQMF